MSVQTITLDLPDALYRQIQRAAKKAHRPVNDVLIEAVAAAAPVVGSTTSELRSALAQMAYLNDATLFQAARSTIPVEQRERLEMLQHEQQRRGLTAEEKAEEEALVALYRETILVRAQAAVLLKQRGYDVSDPTQFAPLE
jgi:hypothetical protein